MDTELLSVEKLAHGIMVCVVPDAMPILGSCHGATGAKCPWDNWQKIEALKLMIDTCQKWINKLENQVP